MNKRMISILLIFVLCFTIVPAVPVNAAEKDAPVISDWAYKDLVIGDRYNIYPLTWYENSLTGKITKAQMEVLITGLSNKIREADGVTPVSGAAIELHDNMKVIEVLEAFYTVITNNNYSEDMQLDHKFGIDMFMKDNGIFTGKNGEQGLLEKCTAEQACVFAARIVNYVYNKLNAASKGLLWEVKNNGNTAYLLGSIHVADNSIYPFSDKMLEAYKSSDSLVVEVNLNDQTGLNSFISLIYYTDGTTLKDHVSAGCYERAIKLASELGFTEKITASLKPWYLFTIFTTLSSSSGDLTEAQKAASLGIDISFMEDAQIDGKPIQEIEGYEKQGKMLDGFSDELQEYLLNSSMDNYNKVTEGSKVSDTDIISNNLVNNWLDAWHDGDVDRFKSSFNIKNEVMGNTFDSNNTVNVKPLMDEYYKALLTDRDKGMADYIDNLLKGDGEHTYFVIVGALHYMNDYSVLDRLKEKGYEITQVK